jgi:hypothetical protein
MAFPERVYTTEEVQKAKQLIEKGYKHRIKLKGSKEFRQKVKEALHLIKIADYLDFFRTYIRQIVEMDGFSQLRTEEVGIWANKYTLADTVDAASYFIHKAQQMKDFLEGKLYYDTGEINAIKKRIQFIETLRDKSRNQEIKQKCEELLKRWDETLFP